MLLTELVTRHSLLVARRSSIITLLCVLAPLRIEGAMAQVAGESALTWQIPQLPPPAPISPDEFAARRRALVNAMRDGVLVVPGARAPERDYLPFQQTPAFRYLTGILEPDAALIVSRAGGRVREWLFVQPRVPAREIWEGARLGPAAARELTGLPAEDNDRFLPVLDSLLASRPAVYVLESPPETGSNAELGYGRQLLNRISARVPGIQFHDLSAALQALRARKSPAELDRIRRAVYITAEAHRQAMMATEPQINEFEIRALVEFNFRRFGGDGPAYLPIVGSGPNSTTLHYNADDRCMNDGEVLLFDVGGFFDGYAADVTRTIPVNGRFSPEQRDIYGIVLAAQKAAEAQLRQGARWSDLNQAAGAEISRGLARLGLIDRPDATFDCGSAAAPAKCAQTQLFYMHGLGHGVGLEVHDPDISTMAGFQPGSAVTIEPGVYVRADVFEYLPDTPGNRTMIERLRPAMRRYANIGVRIEDVYIFDARGVERASRGVPREIDEIETLMRENAPAMAGRRADIVSWRCQLKSDE